MTSSPPTDADWRSGYADHADRLIRLATMLVGPDDATDLVTDTLRRVTAGRPPTGEVGAYLTRSLVNAAASHYRSLSRRTRREERAALAASTAPVDLSNAIDVRRALGDLSPQQQAVVFLAYWEDLTIPQIADRLDVGEGTVRRQLARAKTRLREVLQ